MKIDKVPGEFAFKALFQTANGWELSTNYYFANPLPLDPMTKWPVEIDSDGFVYIPSEEEL